MPFNYVAEKEHRSLAQETIVLVKESINTKINNKERRQKLLEKIVELNIEGKDLPDPVTLIREDRNFS